MNQPPFRRAILVFLFCCLTAALAVFMRPSKEIASFASTKLEAVIPATFGDWRIDDSIVPIAPDPSLTRAIDRIYSDTLARTYVNSRGQRIMLSLAYGRRQNDTMRLHQPEGCYTGQGFAVRQIGEEKVVTPHGQAGVMRLSTSLGSRKEPVTYWMVVGGQRAISQWQGKLAQLRFGLRGYVPDGLLVRVSSISPEPQDAFLVQDQFILQLLSAVPAAISDSIIGA